MLQSVTLHSLGLSTYTKLMIGQKV